MGQAFPQSLSGGRRDRGAAAIRAGRFRSQRVGGALPQAGPGMSQVRSRDGTTIGYDRLGATPGAPGSDPQRRGHGARSRPEGVLRPMKKFASVAAYLRAVPPVPRAALQKLRKTIKAAAPQATEVISYGMPCFKHHGMLLCFAAFKDHCSLFMSTYLTKTLNQELASYETAKGPIRLTADKPLHAGLVRKLVKARIAQNERRRYRSA